MAGICAVKDSYNCEMGMRGTIRCRPTLGYRVHFAGADPGSEKGGGTVHVASGAHSEDVFGQFKGLFKEFGAKRGGRMPPAPPVWICAFFDSIIRD